MNLRGVSTKLNKYIVFIMQTYKKLNRMLGYLNDTQHEYHHPGHQAGIFSLTLPSLLVTTRVLYN